MKNYSTFDPLEKDLIKEVRDLRVLIARCWRFRYNSCLSLG